MVHGVSLLSTRFYSIVFITIVRGHTYTHTYIHIYIYTCRHRTIFTRIVCIGYEWRDHHPSKCFLEFRVLPWSGFWFSCSTEIVRKPKVRKASAQVQIGIARDRQIDLQRKKRMDELKVRKVFVPVFFWNMTWIWHGFLLQRHVLIMSCASQEKRTGVGAYTASLFGKFLEPPKWLNRSPPKGRWCLPYPGSTSGSHWEGGEDRCGWDHHAECLHWGQIPSPALGGPWKVNVGKAWGGNWWFLDKQWLDYREDERFSLVSKDADCCRQCLAQAPQTAAHLVPVSWCEVHSLSPKTA